MLYPVFALVCFTFIFLLINFVWRFRSVKKKTVRARYYKLMQQHDGDNPTPDYIVAGTRHFANLFELPILFYLAAILAITQNAETLLMVSFAWVFVVVRIVHAYIHVTYNHILHRLLIFWAGTLALMGIWIQLGILLL